MSAGYADAPVATTQISIKYLEISRMLHQADLHTMELSRTL